MSITVIDLERTVNSGLTTTIKKSEINFEQLFIDVDVDNIISTILFLKTNEKCRFKQLIDITAVDYPEKEKRFKIVYLLLSHVNNLRIVINAYINEKTLVPSITNIFPSANWMEREVRLDIAKIKKKLFLKKSNWTKSIGILILRVLGSVQSILFKKKKRIRLRINND